MKKPLYTNAGFTGEMGAVHSGAYCAMHSPDKKSPLWKRQGWRKCTDKTATCKHCEGDLK